MSNQKVYLALLCSKYEGIDDILGIFSTKEKAKEALQRDLEFRLGSYDPSPEIIEKENGYQITDCRFYSWFTEEYILDEKKK